DVRTRYRGGAATARFPRTFGAAGGAAERARSRGFRMNTTSTARLGRSVIQGYHRTTRTATYGFIASLPLLILYEVMMLLIGIGRAAQVRVGAEIWSKQFLNLLGLHGTLALSGAVILIGVGVVLYERKKSI